MKVLNLLILAIEFCCISFVFNNRTVAQKSNQPNIIFIVSDDLNAYENNQVQSPHLETFASKSTVFHNHLRILTLLKELV